MTDEMGKKVMRDWMDGASYLELLTRWRFADEDDGIFQNDMGKRYVRVMGEKKSKLSEADQVAISKRVGWEI